MTVKGASEERLLTLEREVASLRNDVVQVTSRAHDVVYRKLGRPARILAPVTPGDNTFNVMFVDGTYTQTAGSQTPTFTDRQSAAGKSAVAHNLTPNVTPSVGDMVRCRRVSRRWWFQLDGEPTAACVARVAVTTQTLNELVAPDLYHWDTSSSPIVTQTVLFGYQAVTFALIDSAIRYKNVEIPQGATILGAFIRKYDTLTGDSVPVYSEVSSVGGSDPNITERVNAKIKLTISGHDADDSTHTLVKATWQGRTRTTANVAYEARFNWTSGPWPGPAPSDWDVPTEGAWPPTDDLPDVKDVLQEIVDRPGWQAGNDLSLIFDDNGSWSSPPSKYMQGAPTGTRLEVQFAP